VTVRPTRLGAASLAALGVALALLSGIEFAGPASPEPDSYYHVRYAALLARGELPRGRFPWASASTWADAFADKDWLYHAALVPFVRALGPDLVAAKTAALVFAALLVGTLALALARRGAPRPGELALFGLVSSYTLLQRVTVARTLTLAVTLTVLLFLALVERRAWLALLGALAFPLAYAAVQVPLALGLVVAAGLRLRGERLGAWTGAALAVGTTGGVLLHPDFPRNVTLAWDQNARVLGNAWGGTRLGLEEAVEFRGYHVSDVALGSLPLWLGLAVAATLVLLSDARLSLGRVRAVSLGLVAVVVGGLFVERWSTREFLLVGSPLVVGFIFLVIRALRRAEGLGGDTSAALLLAGAATLGAALSVRFLEYAAPLGTLALGLVARDSLASPETRARAAAFWTSFRRPTRLVGSLALAAVALLAAGKLVRQAIETTASARARNESAGRWLSAHARPGEVVYHARWDAFPELFYFAPDQRYLVALDPAFLYYADADHRRYDLWDAIRTGRVDPGEALAFGSRFIVTDAATPDFSGLETRLRAAATERRATLRDASAGVEVWEVTKP
jgi:hypothetical protein